MPLNLSVHRNLSARSDRVKCVDFHPKNPWVLTGLYTGHASIWNYETESLVKTLEISAYPIRSAKFIPNKHWIICACDDTMVHVYNYNTMERVVVFQAHYDFIRSISVHSTLPLVLTSSDDTTIRLWNYEKNWSCEQVFEGHSHYVMQVAFNPKDENTFASASLDRTIKVWTITNPNPNYTLEGHELGVNCVSYVTSGDKPYLLSGGDDKQVRLWDYSTKQTITILEGHTENLSAAIQHPSLPLIISASEDGTVRLWNSNTFRQDTVLRYDMDRAWCLAYLPDSMKLAIGYDQGLMVVDIGREEPIISMDSNGKVLWLSSNVIYSGRLKAAEHSQMVSGDGDCVPIPGKEMLICENYPQSIQYNSNGRLVVLCSNGEYVIHTALTLSTQHHGPALDFVWGADSGTYATREKDDTIRIYHQFVSAIALKIRHVEQIFGSGAMLGIKTKEYVDFYDWNTGTAIIRLEVPVKNIVWNQAGTHVALVTEETTYVLKYNSELVNTMLAANSVPEDGLSDALEPIGELQESVRSMHFYNEILLFTTMGNKVAFFIGNEVINIGFTEKPLYILGYIPKDNRLYCVNSKYEICSYTNVPVHVMMFHSAVYNNDIHAAMSLIPQIDPIHYNKLSSYLQTKQYYKEALSICVDLNQTFTLACTCLEFEVALQTAYKLNSSNTWMQLGDLALQHGVIPLAQHCFVKSKDYSSLLLLFTTLNYADGLRWLISETTLQQPNVAFSAAYILGDRVACIDILQSQKMYSQAVLFARTYAPSLMTHCVDVWKANTSVIELMQAITHPDIHPHHFPWLQDAIALENSTIGNQAMRKAEYTSHYANATTSTQPDVSSSGSSGSNKKSRNSQSGTTSSSSAAVTTSAIPLMPVFASNKSSEQDEKTSAITSPSTNITTTTPLASTGTDTTSMNEAPPMYTEPTVEAEFFTEAGITSTTTTTTTSYNAVPPTSVSQTDSLGSTGSSGMFQGISTNTNTNTVPEPTQPQPQEDTYDYFDTPEPVQQQQQQDTYDYFASTTEPVQPVQQQPEPVQPQPVLISPPAAAIPAFSPQQPVQPIITSPPAAATMISPQSATTTTTTTTTAIPAFSPQQQYQQSVQQPTLVSPQAAAATLAPAPTTTTLASPPAAALAPAPAPAPAPVAGLTSPPAAVAGLQPLKPLQPVAGLKPIQPLQPLAALPKPLSGGATGTTVGTTAPGSRLAPLPTLTPLAPLPTLNKALAPLPTLAPLPKGPSPSQPR